MPSKGVKTRHIYVFWSHSRVILFVIKPCMYYYETFFSPFLCARERNLGQCKLYEAPCLVGETALMGPYPDSKVYVANTGPIWGRQDPGGPHLGPMNFVIWAPLWGSEEEKSHNNGLRPLYWLWQRLGRKSIQSEVCAPIVVADIKSFTQLSFTSVFIPKLITTHQIFTPSFW